ncbi:MAG: hypothetical protein EA424_05205 [Planctomycetaceae bacterium]|nr:MAG: hypothetical protein EA424_05205 [Planctomycetaceae bacterium]
MIARWPGRIERGRVDHTPWYFTDVLPTFAQLAGAPVPRGIDGASIVPSLLGRAQPELADRFMYWEFHEGGFQQAVRQGEWKAVLPQRGQPMELYHLPTDIAESRNVAPDNPDMVGRITEYLKTARTESEEWPVG